VFLDLLKNILKHTTAASRGDNVPEHIYRKQLENGKFVNTIGFVLLESRSSDSNFIGDDQ
jgi:hypothetical protein